jgi:hypothetical protein
MEALTIRGGGDQLLKLGHNLAMTSEAKLRFHQSLVGGQPFLIKVVRRDRGEWRIPDVGKRRPPPQAERRAEQSDCIRRVTTRQGLAAARGQISEHPDV